MTLKVYVAYLMMRKHGSEGSSRGPNLDVIVLRTGDLEQDLLLIGLSP